MWAPSCPWPVTMALVMALVGGVARADWVSDPAAGMPEAGVAASGVLDRALQVDPQAQQRNLGVLLDARQAPDGNALLQRRPDGTLARRPVWSSSSLWRRRESVAAASARSRSRAMVSSLTSATCRRWARRRNMMTPTARANATVSASQ